MQTRRQFLKTTLGTLVAGASLAPTVQAQPDSPELASVFAGLKLTDQYGQPFAPEKTLAGKPCIVLFGFNGCTMCGTKDAKEREGISASVAAIQQRLVREGIDAPIVVVSVKPDDDKTALPSYTATYYSNGVRQLASENVRTLTKDGFKDYEAARETPVEKRIFHIAIPESQQQSVAVITRINTLIAQKKLSRDRRLLFDVNDPTTHPSRVVLFDKGELVDTFATLDKMTPLKGAAAETVVNAIKARQQVQGQRP